jgi:cytochrome c oxidase cbb3-type subunit 4
MNMDFTLIDSVLTVVVMVVFIGIVFWAWSSRRATAFNEAANLPFTEDEPVSAEQHTKENSHG